jgi:hypothetical protein
VQRMGQCGFAVTVERARTHPTGGSWNFLFMGRVGEPDSLRPGGKPRC